MNSMKKNVCRINRRYILLALLSTIFIIADAQVVTVNDMSAVKPGSKINFVIDFSKATIMSMNETDFSNYEKDWNKDKPTIIGRFQKGVNNKLNGILNVGSYPDSQYTLKVTVTAISDVGNVYCDAVITDKDGTVLFSVNNVNGGSEPPILPGSKLARIKTWAFLTGRSLGNNMKSEYLAQ